MIKLCSLAKYIAANVAWLIEDRFKTKFMHDTLLPAGDIKATADK